MFLLSRRNFISFFVQKSVHTATKSKAKMRFVSQSNGLPDTYRKNIFPVTLSEDEIKSEKVDKQYKDGYFGRII